MIGRSQPTLFLDIDGVLHPSLATAGQYFCRMPLLVEAMTDLDIAVVISSSWRFHHQWEALIAPFPRTIQSKFVGCTGPAMAGSNARFREISAYVRQRRIGHWCALDDSQFEFPNYCPELIICDGAYGLTTRETGLLRDWVNHHG